MSREAYAPPDPNAWCAASLKLILFPMAPQQREPREWWSEIVGKEPDEVSRKKDTVVEAGLLEPGRRLTVIVNPLKLQINLDRVPKEEDQNRDLPSLGPFFEEQEKFLALVCPWLQRCPPVKRIGYAPNIMYPATTHDDVYRLLDRFLQTVDVDPESSDFTYRVNRKTQSTAAPVGTEVNQLMMWTAQRIVMRAFAVTPDKIEMRSSGDDDVSFLDLELDVNTSATREGAFEANEVEGLCRELAELASQRARIGDVRRVNNAQS